MRFVLLQYFNLLSQLFHIQLKINLKEGGINTLLYSGCDYYQEYIIFLLCTLAIIIIQISTCLLCAQVSEFVQKPIHLYSEIRSITLIEHTVKIPLSNHLIDKASDHILQVLTDNTKSLKQHSLNKVTSS